MEDGTLYVALVMPFYSLAQDQQPPAYSTLDPTMYQLHRVWAHSEDEPVPQSYDTSRHQARGATARPSTNNSTISQATSVEIGQVSDQSVRRPRGRLSAPLPPASPAASQQPCFKAKALGLFNPWRLLAPLFIRPASECLACGDEFPSSCRLSNAFMHRRFLARKNNNGMVIAPIEPASPITLACKHTYCQPCLTKLISIACDSEATFPPHCCQKRITFRCIQRNTTDEIADKYLEMLRVVQIPLRKRWYCICGEIHDGRILAAENVTTWKCQKCERGMCVLCKQAEHVGSTCREEDVVAELNRRKLETYKSCPRCGIVIDLVDGCRHVRCRCGMEFCYICRHRWAHQNTCTSAYKCARAHDTQLERRERHARREERWRIRQQERAGAIDIERQLEGEGLRREAQLCLDVMI